MTGQRFTKLPTRNFDVLRAITVLCVLTDYLLTVWSVHLPKNGRWAIGLALTYRFIEQPAIILGQSLDRRRIRRVLEVGRP